MKTFINYDQPTSFENWDALALANSNLLCSTAYDSTQAYYKLRPIFFEFYENEQLVAGVKLYSSCNSKLPFLSRQAMQFGECIFAQDKELDNELLQVIDDKVKDFISEEGYISLTVSSYYGRKEMLLDPFNVTDKYSYYISTVDLNRDLIDIRASFKTSHKRSCSRAQKEGLIFKEVFDVGILISLLEETYKDQQQSGPSAEYIRHLYHQLQKKELVSIFAVLDGEQYLCAAMIMKYGSMADYTFGGTRRNDKGAGQFLHDCIISTLKNSGVELYSLGQTAMTYDVNNIKFSEGITRFKRGFGTVESEGFKYEYVLNKTRYNLYKIILKMYNLWK